jgi:hypothetical protein
MDSPIEEDSHPVPPLRPRRAPASWLFRLVVPVTFLFVFTCFLMLTHDLLGDQNSKFAALLRDHGTKILGWEAAVAIGIAIVAMTVDRIKTLKSAPSTDATRNQPEDTDGQPKS